MKAEQLQELFPHASTAFLRLNTATHTPHREAPASIVERHLRTRPLAKGKVKGGDTGRFLVRVKSYRRRLLDEDNLCCKYVVDCCRYAGLIPGDAPGTTSIATSQEKVRSKEEERTEIVIETIP